MNWQGPEVCRLCGNDERRELRWALVKWNDAEPGMSYEHIGRCENFTACRSRVEADGERWPIEERKGVVA